MKNRTQIIKYSILIVSSVFIAGGCMNFQATDYQAMIEQGEYTQASQIIRSKLADPKLSIEQRLNLEFELERMARIRHDFTKTEAEIREYVLQYIPTASADDFKRWEGSQALEWRMIDGEKRYFNRADRNLFRIDAGARKIWDEQHRDAAPTPGSGANVQIDSHNARIITDVAARGRKYVQPVRLRIIQSVHVNGDVVPAGEILRCWIPFPRNIPGRQDEIRLIATEPARNIVAPDEILQRTVYLEKPAVAGEATEFSVEYEYTARGTWTNIDPARVTAVDPAEMAEYLCERPPHIVFTPEIRAISQQVVGTETNPHEIAKLLFKWVDENIPWASAREYSTIRNIPAYAIANQHGDCGIQGLTFIALCRLNGIPARWQSGWEFKPPDDSMHDWGMLYFEPYGWVPMDPTYGIRDVDDERGKWFYVNGMDSYRTIYNDDYSQPFYPAKIHPRSETVDSQRGEVEWRGGNLYFDQWDWTHDWQIID